MNVCPPTVIVAFRLAQLPVFPPTLKVTVPFPVPVLLVVNQFVLLTALQAQPIPAVIPTLPLLALAKTFVLLVINA